MGYDQHIAFEPARHDGQDERQSIVLKPRNGPITVLSLFFGYRLSVCSRWWTRHKPSIIVHIIFACIFFVCTHGAATHAHTIRRPSTATQTYSTYSAGGDDDESLCIRKYYTFIVWLRMGFFLFFSTVRPRVVVRTRLPYSTLPCYFGPTERP